MSFEFGINVILLKYIPSSHYLIPTTSNTNMTTKRTSEVGTILVTLHAEPWMFV